MKKKSFVILFVLIMLFTFSIGSLVNAANEDELRFVFVPKCVHPWYDMVKEGANECADFLTNATGQKVVIDWVAPKKADVTLHAQTIERAIATKPDGIAVAILDANANKQQLKESMERGIPTVVYDSVVPEGVEVTSAIGSDFTQDGRDRGELIAEMIDYKGKVALLIGCPTAPNHQMRIEGTKEVFAKYPDIEIVAEAVDNDSIDQAQKVASQIIAAHPDIDAMLGCNAAGPIGIGIAIKEADKIGDILYLGESPLPQMVKQVEDGICAGTLVQRVNEVGWWSTMTLWLACEDKVVPEVIDTGTFMVYPDDIPGYEDKL